MNPHNSRHHLVSSQDKTLFFLHEWFKKVNPPEFKFISPCLQFFESACFELTNHVTGKENNEFQLKLFQPISVYYNNNSPDFSFKYLQWRNKELQYSRRDRDGTLRNHVLSIEYNYETKNTQDIKQIDLSHGNFKFWYGARSVQWKISKMAKCESHIF